jgi:hypothetical protein
MGFNAPEHRLLPEDHAWEDGHAVHRALETVASALRPWTIDFHVAQNDGTVHGSGAHDRTGRHCLPDAPEGKLDIIRDSGLWLRDESGQLTRKMKHICWDGCMFPNETMLKPETWTSILSTMLSVRNAHGWSE